MRNIFLVILFLIGGSSSYCQNENKNRIYIEEYDCYFTPRKVDCTDTIVKSLEDGRVLKISLYGCMGKMHIECFRNNQKIEEGDYISSLCLLRKYVRSLNANTGITTISVREYYQPLRSGEWFIYNSEGRLIEKKMYMEGLEQDN